MKTFHRLAYLAAGAAAWGLFESQWVRLTSFDLPVAGLPAELDGLRVAHLSDLHVGAPGLNARAALRAAELVRGQQPDLVCVTGDLRARRAGDDDLRRALALLDAPLGAFAVLGNHDHADGHDPFADGDTLTDLDGTPVHLLSDETATVACGSATIHVAGMAPRTFAADEAADGAGLVRREAALRILLCHYPPILDRVAPGDWDVVLAGHLHGGQLCIPYPGGKFRLAHLSRQYLEGTYVREGTAMHVSRGVGTTFVPFRFAARPEATVLRLVAA